MNRLYINKDWSTLKKLLAMNAASGGATPKTKTLSGSLVTFTTKKALPLIDCKAEINPVQDLHGYEHPWPAGGGKNKLSLASLTLGGTESRTKRVEIDAIQAGTYVFTATNTGTEASIVNYGLQFFDAVTGGSKVGDVHNGAIFTLTGEAKSVYFYMDSDSYSAWKTVILSNMMVRLSSVSDATFSPYSNICPITGWTGAKVTRTGKNLFDYSKITVDRRIDITNGNAVGVGSNDFYVSDYTPISGGQTYTLNFSYSSSANYGAAFYDAQKNFISGIRTGSATSTAPFTFTSPSDAEYIRFTSHVPNTIPASEVMLELGSTATAYEPYSGTTYSITFPSEAGTVYGGSLDVTNGVLTVEKYGIMVNESNHRFAKYGNYWHITPYDYPTIKVVSGGTAPVLVYSDITSGNTKWGTAQNGTQMFTRATDWTGVFNSVDELTALGITVVYELATPITYQLTPQEITTLIGTNNVWADTGDITVTYRK